MFNKDLAATNMVQKYGMGLGGYLFNWGTPDANGIKWERSTNYGIGWWSSYPIQFSHGLNEDIGIEPVGTIKAMKKTDNGLMIAGEFYMEHDWYEVLCTLLEKGSLVWTAAPASHLVKSENGVWINFPIVTFSVHLASNRNLEETFPEIKS